LAIVHAIRSSWLVLNAVFMRITIGKVIDYNKRLFLLIMIA
jgi:hypothetical protein